MRLFRARLARLAFCAILAVASIGGAPMRPEEIEELMYSMTQPKIAHSLPDDTENGDDLLRKLLGPHSEPRP